MKVRRARHLIQIYRDRNLQDTTENREGVYIRQYSKQATAKPNEANDGGKVGTGQDGNQVSSAGGRHKALYAFTLKPPCYENILSILNIKYQESCREALTIGFSPAQHKHSIPGHVIDRAHGKRQSGLSMFHHYSLQVPTFIISSSPAVLFFASISPASLHLIKQLFEANKAIFP